MAFIRRTRKPGGIPLRLRPLLAYRPWVHFALFACLNAWLSWAPSGLALKYLVFTVTFLPLLLLAAWGQPRAAGRPLWEKDSFAPSPWVWAVLLGLGVFLRFYKLTSLPVWPVTDEGRDSFLAMHLNRQWHWNLFFNSNHVSAGYYWLLALFFRLFPPSLFSLWLFPVLASLAAWGLGYWACRRFFPKTLSFLWAGAFGLGFWPLYLSHFNTVQVLSLLWECACFGLASFCLLPAKGRPSRPRWAVTGMALGMGFYFYIPSWLPVWAVLTGALLLRVGSPRSAGHRPGLLLSLLLPMALPCLPLVAAWAALPPDRYFSRVSAFQDGMTPYQYLATLGSNVTGLFWGTHPDLDYFAYRPLWGGFFDPIAGALCFLGLIELFKWRRHIVARWFVIALLAVYLPLLLAGNLELFRLAGAMPLLLFAEALGALVFLNSLKGRAAGTWVLALTAALSAGLGAYHLAVAYPAFWEKNPGLWDQYAKQRECYDAYYGVLEPLSRSRGPGFILTEFSIPLDQDPRDQNLLVASYPFDAQANPGIGVQKAQWAALFIKGPDLPFLRRRFPGIQWRELGRDLSRQSPEYPYYMAVLPVDGATGPLLERWASANLFLQEILYRNLCPASAGFRQDINGLLLENYGLFKGDPFLETHFWRVLAVNSGLSGQYKVAANALQLGLERGYPTADAYFFLGKALVRAGDREGARDAFTMAGRLDPALKPPPDFLRLLGETASPSPGG